LAEGQSLSEILQQLGHVAEGVYAAAAAQSLSMRLDIEMPITQAIYGILYECVPAREAVEKLLNRDPKVEHF
jgi:glycerol-3-phosphate dehydrogenase (NAD(P)+)